MRLSGDIGVRLRSLRSYAEFSTAMLQSMSYVGVIIVGVYVIAEGHLTTGGLIACSILASRVLTTTSGITRLLLQWHHAKHALGILDKVLSNPSDDDPTRQANTHVAPLDPLAALVADFLKRGGTLWACTPCVKARGYSQEHLIEGTVITGASVLHEPIKSGAATLSF